MERRQFLATVGAGFLARQLQAQGNPYKLESDALGKILKTPDGRVVFEYMTKKPDPTPMSANSVCCFHPLNTPSGERITVFGEGHPHYRGLFFAWHTIEFHERVEPPPRPAGRGPRPPQNGQQQRRAAPPPTGPRAEEILARTNAPGKGNVLRGDYWGWGRYAPLAGRVIQNRDVRLVKADGRSAELEIENDWIISEQALMREVTTAAVHEVPNAFVTDLTYRFTPNYMDLVLNEWSFGGLCLAGRSDAVTGYYEGPNGRMDLPDPGMVDGDSDWPAADWYSRTGTLKNGKVVGGAVINHASNPPTRWWNPPSTGDLDPSIVTFKEITVPQGETLTLRYRVLSYDGAFPASRIDQLSSEWRNT